jgi:hypothetical protein
MSMREMLYGLLAVAGAVVGWHYNLQYLQQPDAGWIDWIRQCLVNPAASSALADLAFTYAIVGIWIVLEGRRLAMRQGWLFVAVTVFVSLALGLGLFLIFRERRLRSLAPATPG